MKSSSSDVPAAAGATQAPAPPPMWLEDRARPVGGFRGLVAAAATAGLRTVGRTWNLVERRNEDYTALRLLGERRNVLLALWHDRILYTLYYMARRFRPHGVRFSLMISASKDGDILAGAVNRFGGDAVRGSSSRRGREALMGMLDRLERGYNGVITPDGPRGPRYKAHAGIALLAQKSGVPIVPVIAGARHAWRFNSWDRFMLPLPGSPVRLLYGDPIWVPANADDAMREHFRQKLEDDLNALAREADDWRTLRRPLPDRRPPH
ncbi:MAG: lysophospholipid acyltransferase family protein [Planctomycetia bacterium]|nr:lysophospholipid acyltransferase family protein [Planctomycetia bacterium]